MGKFGKYFLGGLIKVGFFGGVFKTTFRFVVLSAYPSRVVLRIINKIVKARKFWMEFFGC